MNEEILRYFKIGYSLNMNCDEHFWDNLELFMMYRAALTYMSLCQIDEIGVIEDAKKVKAFFTYLVSSDDIMSAMTNALTDLGGIE